MNSRSTIYRHTLRPGLLDRRCLWRGTNHAPKTPSLGSSLPHRADPRRQKNGYVVYQGRRYANPPQVSSSGHCVGGPAQGCRRPRSETAARRSPWHSPPRGSATWARRPTRGPRPSDAPQGAARPLRPPRYRKHLDGLAPAPRQNPESLSSSVDSNPQQQQQQPRSPASSTDSIQSGGSTTWRSEWERFLGEPHCNALPPSSLLARALSSDAYLSPRPVRGALPGARALSSLACLSPPITGEPCPAPRWGSRW